MQLPWGICVCFVAMYASGYEHISRRQTRDRKSAGHGIDDFGKRHTGVSSLKIKGLSGLIAPRLVGGNNAYIAGVFA